MEHRELVFSGNIHIRIHFVNENVLGGQLSVAPSEPSLRLAVFAKDKVLQSPSCGCYFLAVFFGRM